MSAAILGLRNTAEMNQLYAEFQQRGSLSS